MCFSSSLSMMTLPDTEMNRCVGLNTTLICFLPWASVNGTCTTMFLNFKLTVSAESSRRHCEKHHQRAANATQDAWKRAKLRRSWQRNARNECAGCCVTSTFCHLSAAVTQRARLHLAGTVVHDARTGDHRVGEPRTPADGEATNEKAQKRPDKPCKARPCPLSSPFECSLRIRTSNPPNSFRLFRYYRLQTRRFRTT